MSAFVYHRVPEDFQGSTIYPLTGLKEIYPEIYIKRAQKYDWRPQVMEQPVYPLKCLWNDCIFLMATDPTIVKQKLYEVDSALRFPTRFWKIDANRLEPENTTIYTFKSNMRPTPSEDFVTYDPHALEQFAGIPDRTITYWKKQLLEKKPLLLYMYIPHIMYKGEIDTTNTEIIEV